MHISHMRMYGMFVLATFLQIMINIGYYHYHYHYYYYYWHLIVETNVKNHFTATHLSYFSM